MGKAGKTFPRSRWRHGPEMIRGAVQGPPWFGGGTGRAGECVENLEEGLVLY